jgi:integrase
VRDRALLLNGFAGALRRSELVALDVADITEDSGAISATSRPLGVQVGRGTERRSTSSTYLPLSAVNR